MAYPSYLREKARRLRIERCLSIDEIAARLALPKTTVHYWVRDLPLGRERRENNRNATLAMQAKYRRIREDAYAQGLGEYEELIKVPTFKDFVILYIAEGYKRRRNVVSICNSDARIMAMAAGWLTRLTERRLKYSIQYHADQDLGELRRYWGATLRIEGSIIALQRKSNSGKLAGRSWRSAHGVLTIGVSDTVLRARLEAWIYRVRIEWALDSATRSGA